MQIIADREAFRLGFSLERIKEFKYFLILLGVMLSGMLFGVLGAKGISAQFDAVIEKWFESFLSFRQTAGFGHLFFNLFLSGLIYYCLISFSSLGMSGLVIIPIIMFARGLGVSLISGILYRSYSLVGIAFADLILLPFFIANCFLMLYLSAEGMELSSLFCASVKDVSAKGTVLKPKILLLLKKILLCLLCSAAVSLVEATFTACFIKYFNFG